MHNTQPTPNRAGRVYYVQLLCHVAFYPICCRLYDQYSFQVIPALGEVVAGDRDSYQYLVESIREFPNQVIYNGRCVGVQLA